MSNSNLEEMLRAPDKKIPHSSNILARLFRTILSDINLNYNTFDKMINSYLERQQGQVPLGKKAVSRERGNLVKELTGDSLTIKNFSKALQVLYPIRGKLTIEIEWRENRKTVHSVNFNVRDAADMEDNS